MRKGSKNKRNLLRFIFLGGFLLFLFRKEHKKNGFDLKNLEHNFLDFAHKEEKELREFASGKESFEEYVEDSSSVFKDYFIPHHGNNHHPLLLRKKPLLATVVLAVLLKVSLVGYLFFVYPNDGSMNEDIRVGVFNMLNEEREKAGLEALDMNKSLLDSAEGKALDMIENDYFAHQSLDGRMPWDWVSKRQYPYLYVGENLGMNFSSAESVHKALMESPSHKKNIMNEKYTDVGIIVKRGVINGKETNILVQLFGARQEEKIIPNNNVALAGSTEDLAIQNNVQENKSKEDTIDVLAVQKNDTATSTATEAQDEPEKVSPPKPDKKIQLLKTKIENEIALEEQRNSTTSALLLGDKARSYIVKKEEPKQLEKNLSDDMKFVSGVQNIDRYSFATGLSDFLNIVLVTLLTLFSLALFLKIFIKISIQHKPVLLQASLLILLLVGLYSTRLHFLEKIPSYIAIY